MLPRKSDAELMSDSHSGAEKLFSAIRNFFFLRPSSPATTVNNFKASDMTTVSNAIHTGGQLRAYLLSKAAFAGFVRPGDECSC